MKVKKEIAMEVKSMRMYNDETEIVLDMGKIKASKLPSPGQKVKVSWEEEE